MGVLHKLSVSPVMSTDCVIVDYGSELIKSGYASDNTPTIASSYFVETADGEYTVKNTCEYKTITNTDDFSTLLRHTLSSYEGADQIIMPQSFSVPKYQISRAYQILFEEFTFNDVAIPCSSALPLYNIESTTGITVDIGSDIVEVAAICDGDVAATGFLPLGSRSVTNYLMRTVAQSGSCRFNDKIFTSDFARVVKERCCEVSLDYYSDLKMYQSREKLWDKKYRLPDGNTIWLASERFRAPEILFTPNIEEIELHGFPGDYDGLHDIIQNVINCVESPTLRTKLYHNICLSGGGSMLRGLPERLAKEFQLCEMGARIVAPPDRAISIWNGAAKLFSMEDFREQFNSRTTYDEKGPFYLTEQYR